MAGLVPATHPLIPAKAGTQVMGGGLRQKS